MGKPCVGHCQLDIVREGGTYCVLCELCGVEVATVADWRVGVDLVHASRSAADTEARKDMHAILMASTEGRPRRVVKVGGLPYLERYYMGELPSAAGAPAQWWLHRFLRGDSERHLHTHPWCASSSVLLGWYLEELGGGSSRVLSAGRVNRITFDTLHRVAAVAPDTWTSLVVNPERRPSWDFIDDAGGRVTVLSAGPDWWKGYEPRPAAENVGMPVLGVGRVVELVGEAFGSLPFGGGRDA